MDQTKYTILDPTKIEDRSFEIITEELGHLTLPEPEASVVKRVIHTTADFEYGRITEIHPDSIESGRAALAKGCIVYCDTNMIVAGANKRVLKSLGCEILTYVDNAEVAAEAKASGITRSIVGINKAAADEKTAIYVIGNAPTALVRICELIESGNINPALVIGVPVGFVGAAESKEMIRKMGVPYVVTNGRKGGSTVAVAILNAIMYGLKRD